jgi:hypothetical protein
MQREKKRDGGEGIEFVVSLEHVYSLKGPTS